jgi:pimeloyl-ACP methyl ester carboxylesterase
MIKYKYLRLNKYKKLRYLSINEKSKNFVVFLHGFMSDIEGSKPKNFLRYCKSKKIGFLTFEYSGHGKSSGEFTKGNISKWTYETKRIIRRIVRNNNFILIGSSMGSWVSLNQFKFFSKQIKGFVGIGSAPEFLERLMWKKFSKKIKNEIITKGLSVIKNGQYEYPITFQLIKDGRKNKILSKKIRSRIKVTMVHGSKDEVVPVSFSRKVLSVFPNAQKKLVVIKNGDHSLSNQVPLKKIIKELKSVVKDII